jgi:MFS transporter, DHA2 family, methylenomycin A resistance protein
MSGTLVAVTVSTADRPRGMPGERSSERSSREAWTRLAACAAAAALLQLDGTLVTVALPSVARGLKVSSASTSTVLAAYFTAYAVALLPAGVLVDRLGARRVALLGLGVFAVGAAAGALATSFLMLTSARVVQGAGAGFVSPAALAGAVSGFPAERRGAALGVWGASAGLANLVGPVLGGLLTLLLGWRADWWVLVPLAMMAGFGITRHVPPVLRDGSPADTPGVLNRVVVAATAVAALTFSIMIGAFYLAEQYLQDRAGYSALGASAVLVAVAVLVGVAAPLSGKLVDRSGERRSALVGFITAGTGFALLGLPGIALDSPAAIGPLVPVGLGLGMLFVPASRAALNATPSAAHGRTSAVLSVGRLLGAAAGVGLAGVAISAGPSAATLHRALLAAAALCLLAGIPSAARLRLS